MQRPPLPLKSRNKDLCLALVIGGLGSAYVPGGLVKGLVLRPRLLVLLLTLHPKLFGHAQALQQGPLLLLQVRYDAFLSLPLPHLFL